MQLSVTTAPTILSTSADLSPAWQGEVAAIAAQCQPGDLAVLDCSGSTNPVVVTSIAQTLHAAGVEVWIGAYPQHYRYTGGGVGGDSMFSPADILTAVEMDRPDVRRVFVFTDGQVMPAAPADPARWTWVLPHDGMDWMTAANAGHVLRLPPTA